MPEPDTRTMKEKKDCDIHHEHELAIYGGVKPLFCVTGSEDLYNPGGSRAHARFVAFAELRGERMKQVVVVLVLLSVSWGAVAATGAAGNDLLVACEADERVSAGRYGAGDYGAAGFCQGIVLASMWFSTACLPDGANLGQAKMVAMKFLREHPEHLHEPAPKLVADALGQAFPCKQ